MTTNRDREFLETARLACRLALKHADDVKAAAEYNGRWDDGGASYLRERVALWLGAVTSAVPVPAFLREHWNRAKALQRVEQLKGDPEWAEYRRLWNKFGGVQP